MEGMAVEMVEVKEDLEEEAVEEVLVGLVVMGVVVEVELEVVEVEEVLVLVQEEVEVHKYLKK